MKVSVIIPCYNIEERRSTLSEAVLSVLGQTKKCHEIIIVNDGSEDKSEAVIHEVIEAFGETAEVIRSITLKENGGTSLARNAGIDASIGDFIAFLDFDDLYLPNFIADALRVFNESANTDAVIAPAYFYKNYNDEIKVFVEDIPEGMNEIPDNELISFVVSKNFPAPMGSSLIVRNSIFKNDEALRYSDFLSKRTAEDVHFAYLLLKKNIRPYFLSKPSIIHRTYFRHMSRSYSAYLSTNELEVYDFIKNDVLNDLISGIEKEAPHLIAEIASGMNRKRAQFEMKQFFLEKRYLASIGYLVKNPKRIKSWLHFLLLSFSRIPLFSRMRARSDFSRIVNNEGGREEVIRYLNQLTC